MKETKRYNLAIPQVLYEEIQNIAAEEATTVLEIIKRLIKAGLLVYTINKSDNMSIIIKTEGRADRNLVFM